MTEIKPLNWKPRPGIGMEVQRRADGGMTLTFTGGLQSADSVTGPWADETGASPQTVTFTGAQKFYRAVGK